MYSGENLKQLMLKAGKSLTRSAEIMEVPVEALKEFLTVPAMQDAVMIDFVKKLDLDYPGTYKIIHSLYSLVEYLNRYRIFLSTSLFLNKK